MASVTESTLKQYNSALKRWWGYCNLKSVNVFTKSPEHILEFFAYCFREGNSYGALNSYRVALNQIISNDVLSDIRIKRFFKGVYNLRPNLPRYENIWDPSVVLDYLNKLPCEKLNLKELTFKLAMLLLLATGQRLQTIASIETCNIEKAADKLSIKIPKRLKTSARNIKQPNFIFPYFPNKELCVANIINVYLDKTKNLRDAKATNLLITFRKPYKNASSQSIARWVKTVLGKSGINTDIFSAHSTRHAATSAAARRGITIDTIKNSAGWSKKSEVFAKFYNRPLCTTNFASAILNYT